jgi:hypothetical protein
VVLPLTVEEGVGAGVLVLLPVADEVGVPVPVWLGVALPLSEMEPVLEGLAPAGRDVVGDALTVPLALMVEEGVIDTVPVPDPVADAVGVADAVWLAVQLLLTELI